MEVKNYIIPIPVIDDKETQCLDGLTEKYNKLIAPSKIAKVGTKVGQLVPEKVKELGSEWGASITEQEIYIQAMKYITEGFTALEEQAARFTVSEKSVLKTINKNRTNFTISSLDEICLLRSYEVAKVVNSFKGRELLTATAEGAGTGVIGLWGIPFNLVLSTFIYFRVVQMIAMFYGYDVKNDSSEMVIAGEVFANAISPNKNNGNSEVSNMIAKIMLMSQAEAVKQASKKSWAEMVSKGGIRLLIAQMRALAHKSAEKALKEAGHKGLENSVFREVFEQIGRKLTLKSTGKSVPVASAVVGGLMDTAQMKKVFEYADLFYQKRFIMEKEGRIYSLINEENSVIDVDFSDLNNTKIEEV